MFLAKIKEFYSHHKKTVLFTLFMGFFMFSLGDTAFADEPEKVTNGIIKGVDVLISIAATIIAVLTSLVSLLLEPSWVNGTMFGFETYLKDIWILVSNIVYFIFAFLLITIAFMNIIGKGQEKWALKQALPKFVIGVLIVPFSWFFVQFILSISAFLTVSVLSLPYDVLEGTKPFEEVGDKTMCLNYMISLTKSDTLPSLQDQATAEKGSECSGGGEPATISDILSGTAGEKDGISSSIFGIINIYTYGVMRIDKLNQIRGESTAAGLLSKIVDVGVKVIFDLIFLVMFLVIIVALFLALFARATWLWIHAMFSPLYGLFYFFGNDFGGEKGQKISPVEFLKLAMVPVYVSAALSFGLIFLFVAAHGLSQPTQNGLQIFETTDDGDPRLSMGGFSLTVKGLKGGKVDAKSNTWGGLTEGIGNGLGQIILELFGLAILWLAVMAALQHSKITGGVIAPIADFGESVGKLIAKSPTYAPILPGGLSASGLANMGSTATTAAQAYGRKGSEEFMSKHGMFGKQVGNTGKSKSAQEAIAAYGATKGESFSKLKEALQSYGSTKAVFDDKGLVGSISELAIKMGAMDKDKKINDLTSLSEVLGDIEKKLETDGNYTRFEQLFDNITMKGSGKLTTKRLNEDGYSNKSKNEEKELDTAVPLVKDAVFNVTLPTNITKIDDLKKGEGKDIIDIYKTFDSKDLEKLTEGEFRKKMADKLDDNKVYGEVLNGAEIKNVVEALIVQVNADPKKKFK